MRTTELISEYLTSPPVYEAMNMPSNISQEHTTRELISLLKTIVHQNSQLLEKFGIITLRESQKTAEIIEKENRHAALMPLTPVRPSPRVSTLVRNQSPIERPCLVELKTPSRPNSEEAQGQGLSFVEIQYLKKKSSSRSNFTVNCLRRLFRTEEVQGQNVAGKKGKPPVDPFRVELIKSYAFQMYPVAPDDIHTC